MRRATPDRPEAFELVTAFDAVHDQAHPAQVRGAVARATRPHGIFLTVDIKASSEVEENISKHLAPLLCGLSLMHWMTDSLGLGGTASALSGDASWSPACSARRDSPTSRSVSSRTTP